MAPPVVSHPLPRRVEGLRMSRPWREVKSQRGAPKRVNTEGFACPNPKCPDFGISDDQIHAAFWGWQAWPGRADRRPFEVLPAAPPSRPGAIPLSPV